MYNVATDSYKHFDDVHRSTWYQKINKNLPRMCNFNLNPFYLARNLIGRRAIATNEHNHSDTAYCGASLVENHYMGSHDQAIGGWSGGNLNETLASKLVSGSLLCSIVTKSRVTNNSRDF